MTDQSWRVLALWYMSLFVVAVLLGVGCTVTAIILSESAP